MGGEHFQTFEREDARMEIIQVLRHYLDNVEIEGDNYVWYTNMPTRYYGDDEELKSLTGTWSRYLQWEEQNKDDDDASVQLKVRRNEKGTYDVWVEPFFQGDDVNIDPLLLMNVTVDESRLDEVLDIFIDSGCVYNLDSRHIIDW
jgi:hypothetical protein